MKVILDDKAKNFLESRSVDSVTVEVKSCSSWSGTVLRPMASLGKPYSSDNFTSFVIDGVKVFLMNGIRASNDTIEVSTAKFLFMENLIVNGIIV